MINEPISPTGAWVHTSAVSLNHEAITSQLQIDSSDSHESREQRAESREDAWLDTDDCFTQMNIFKAISKETRPPHALRAHTQNAHHVPCPLLRTPSWLHHSEITKFCFLVFFFSVFGVHSCRSPDWVKFKNKIIFFHWICNIQTSVSF